jgi:hypothetical protein
MTRIGEWIYLILSVLTAMVGYYIHGNVFWAIMDFIFMPFVWCKWLIMHQVNMSIIKHTFMFFMQ